MWFTRKTKNFKSVIPFQISLETKNKKVMLYFEGDEVSFSAIPIENNNNEKAFVIKSLQEFNWDSDKRVSRREIVNLLKKLSQMNGLMIVEFKFSKDKHVTTYARDPSAKYNTLRSVSMNLLKKV